MTRGCTEPWEAVHDRAHWLDLSRLEKGAKVRFCDPWDVFPNGVVPAGTEAIVEENGLNEMTPVLFVRPVQPIDKLDLSEWDGLIWLYPGSYDGAADFNDADEHFPAPVWIVE